MSRVIHQISALKETVDIKVHLQRLFIKMERLSAYCKVTESA